MASMAMRSMTSSGVDAASSFSRILAARSSTSASASYRSTRSGGHSAIASAAVLQPRLRRGIASFKQARISSQALCAEAFARGLDRDPQVLELTKKAMVERLLNEEFPAERTEVSDSDVAAFYESHRAEFVKPATVRLSFVLLRAGQDSPSRAEVKAKTFALLEKARSMPRLDLDAFERLAQESSDRRTQVLHAEIGPLGDDDLRRQYGAAIANAANGLATVGDLSEVVETPEGFHILKLQARQGELSLSLEQARAQIRTKLARERRAADFSKFVDSLKKRAKYELDEHGLAEMAFDVSSPPVPSGRPAPGYIAGAPLD